MKMSNFLPEGYEEPRSKNAGNYFRLNDKSLPEQTERIRVMGTFAEPHTAIMGWESWKEFTDPETGKVSEQPIRMEHTHDNHDKMVEIDRDGNPRHFWAIQIFNVDNNEAQVWGITQRTIQRQLRSFSENPNWGNPQNYVIAVTRQGSGLKTSYTLMPEPPIQPPDDETLRIMSEAKIDLRQMFADQGRGLNPFGAMDGESDEVPF